MVSPPTTLCNTEREQSESPAYVGAYKGAAKNSIEAGARKPRPGVLTKELQWHNDQHEEHRYDYHRG
jgi:hypothetical protein